jgi:UDP-N-acetylenolpyruvoylglucosamine reductase
MDVHYRNVTTLRQNYALSAVIGGHAGTKPEIDAVIAQSLAKRRQSQPVAASAGCIFKNPESIPAGKLIEELAFKNFTVGSARVSDIHGNFIVNDGGATAQDVLTLIHEIQMAAERNRGISLETEVQIVGVDL